jgi:hypothetical protein
MADPIYFGDGIKLACCPTILDSLYIAASGCCSNYYTGFVGGEQSYSIVYTLPTASGSSGQVLTTDDNGNLSWQNNYGGSALRFVVATGGTVNLPFNKSSAVNVSLNAATTFTFSDAAIGVYIVNIKQGVGGSFTVTWPTIKWSGGLPPTLTTSVGKYDIITLIYDGVNYYGTAALNF